MNLFSTKIAGIPCTIWVHYAQVTEGSYSYNAASDWDYYGYKELEYTVCDRRGRPAPWLEKKLTEEDDQRIKSEYFSEQK